MRTMEIDKENIFESKDLYFSAYCKAKGLILIDTRRSNGRVFFIFDNKKKAESLLREFFNGDGMVNISLFTKALQDLKTIIYN